MNSLKYTKQRPIILPVLLIVIIGSWMGGCGTEADGGECPDTSFSQANLDTLEANNPKFIWRVCNANAEYAMENVRVENKWIFDVLSPCDCSNYYTGILGTTDKEWPISQARYEQSNEEYFFIYLESRSANRGLTDSTLIHETPGKYTYYFSFARDTTKPPLQWSMVEIEREAYHD